MRGFKTTTQIYDQKQRLFRAITARGVRRAALAHPETSGSEHLISNWGNESAKKIWRDTWTRWHHLSFILNLD